jgi:hypothetical protein
VERRKNELERFKREINLEGVAAHYGFERDDQRSTSHSVSMDRGGERIVISLSSVGHWQYFSPTHAHQGTVIDFVQHMDRLNLGEVRKVLRTWLAMALPVPGSKKVTQAEKDRGAVAHYIKRFKAAVSSDYLASRGISTETLNAATFRGKILAGYNGAVIFPHWDEQGVCGYEVKGPDITLFAEKGYKSLWVSNVPLNTSQLIVSESGIDSLSYHQLNRPERAVYVVVSGDWSPEVGERIIRMIKKLEVALVVGAFDNDEGGERHAKRLKEITDMLGVEMHKNFPPIRGYDWNKYLQEGCL